jgi:hypothetical protein
MENSKVTINSLLQLPKSGSYLCMLLLYNERTPFVRKILDDQFLMESIEELSGENLVVAYLMDPIRKKQKQFIQEIDIEINPNLTATESEFIFQLTGEKLSIEYPSLLLFQTRGYKISDYYLFKLSDVDDKNKFYKEIVSVIKIILIAIGKNRSKLVRHKFSLVHIIRKDLTKYKTKNIILSGIKNLDSLISLIKNLLFY